MIYIIGASFPGLRFANHLAELSLDFFTFDKKPEIVPDCGDYIVLNNIYMDKYGLRRIANSAVINTLDQVNFHSPYGKVAEVDVKGNYCIYDKSTLEYLLYKKLQKKNRNVIFSARFFDYNKTNSNVFFEEKGKGTLRKAEIIIGSDGLYSNVRDKLFGFWLNKRNMVFCRLRGNFDTKVLDYYLTGDSKGLYKMVCPISSKEAYFVSSDTSKESLDKFLNQTGYSVSGEVRFKGLGYYSGKKDLLSDRAALLGTAGGIFNNLAVDNFFESIKQVDICFDILKQAFKRNKYGAKNRFNFSRQNFYFDSLFTYLDTKAKKRAALEKLSEHKMDKLVAKMKKRKQDITAPYPYEMIESGLKKNFLFF